MLLCSAWRLLDCPKRRGCSSSVVTSSVFGGMDDGDLPASIAPLTALALIATDLGAFLAGEAWSRIEYLEPAIVALGLAARGATVAMSIGLRALQAARVSLR